ncbi:MAG: class I SAM-dependent methyltransferase [Planctomycetota bacterium]|nr:class I SAM-dependent methyltransferase [Planctomycetota bacterium]
MTSPVATSHAQLPVGDAEHMARMDRIYRVVRHVYDASRKFFLLGRDDAIRAIPEDAQTIVEIGCGTARNLIKIASLRPSAQLFGVDASREMLATAEASVARHLPGRRVALRAGLAEDLDPHATFGRAEPFDVALFSYSLSMMPTWRDALDAAVRSVKPGGTIIIVDFWDQAGCPRAFRRLLTWWIAKFGVFHRPELLERVNQLERDGICRVQIRGVLGRYAWIGVLSDVLPRNVSSAG